jgi:hypothetical protein
VAAIQHTFGWHPVAAVQHTFAWHPVAAIQYTFGWHPVAAVQYTFGWHPVAAVQYTFTHKQYTEYTERNIHNNKKIWKCRPFALHLRKKHGKTSVRVVVKFPDIPVAVVQYTFTLTHNTQKNTRQNAKKGTNIVNMWLVFKSHNTRCMVGSALSGPETIPTQEAVRLVYHTGCEYLFFFNSFICILSPLKDYQYMYGKLLNKVYSTGVMGRVPLNTLHWIWY